MGIYTLHKKLIISSQPKIDPEHQIQQIVKTKREHELVLYNDDVNTFDHVIESLVAICNHSHEQAEQCALLVHYKGKCTVKTGSYDELEPLCSRLLEVGLSAEIV